MCKTGVAQYLHVDSSAAELEGVPSSLDCN